MQHQRVTHRERLPTLAPQERRRAVSIAWRIEGDIQADGWRFDTVYGSQSELRKRYGVGDESLHEAIRLLEFNGVARMRPGPGGGLVVERPSLHLAIAAVVGYFRAVRSDSGAKLTLSAINSARASLAAVAAQTASQRVASDTNGEFISRLRHLLLQSETADLPVTLAIALEDPCLRLLACCLNRMGRSAVSAEDKEPLGTRVSDSAALELFAAVIAGQGNLAAERAKVLTLNHPVNWLVDPSPIHDPFVSHESPLNRSRVGQLVREIATELNRKMPEQGHLGSEAELCERYSTGRATLRQALRVLEDARIVTARPGRGLGWFACVPTEDLPIRQMRNYFAGHQVAPTHVHELCEAWRAAALDKDSNPVVKLLVQGMTAYCNSSDLPSQKVATG